MPETDPVTVVFDADPSGVISGATQAKAALRGYGDEIAATDGKTYTLTRQSTNLAAAFFALNMSMSVGRRLLKEFGIENEALNRSLEYTQIALNLVIAGLALVKAAHIIAGFAAHSHAIAAFLAAVAEVSAASLFIFTAAAVATVFAVTAAIMALRPPAAQFGGIVRPRPGGTMVRVGEAGEPEAIIPLHRANQFGFGGGGINVTMNVQTNDPDHLVRVLGRRLQQLQGAGGF